jgi:MoxR-like ATPase
MVNLFKPEKYKTDDGGDSVSFGERGRGKVYVWDQKTVFAIQVAQTTRRPLLLRGPAGSGKSSLAPFVANTLGFSFYPFSVNARTQARDMMWEFDALGRLNDANVSQSDDAAKQRVGERHNYLNPGMLWWAFDPLSAENRGLDPKKKLVVEKAVNPSTSSGANGAVVLIDEIDKADPDVPNNLLEALGSRQFTVQETGTTIQDQRSPLVIITTNEERELPRAFLRRCVVLHLKEKSAAELASIAEQHFAEERTDLYRSVADSLVQLRKEAITLGHRPPSTAEYLDAIDACIKLEIQVPATDEELLAASEHKQPIYDNWKYLIEMALAKRPGALSKHVDQDQPGR